MNNYNDKNSDSEGNQEQVKRNRASLHIPSGKNARYLRNFVSNKMNQARRKRFLKKNANKSLKKIERKALSESGKGLLKLALSTTTGKVIIIILGVCFFAAIIYIGISEADNRSDGGRNYSKISQNKVSSNTQYQIDENGKIVRSKYVQSYSPINAAASAFYEIMASRSYYQVSLEDGKTLIRGDDERYIYDYYNREKYLTLNPDFLYSLDDTIFGGTTIYPEQFIKPVATDFSTMEVMDLLDENNNLTVKSQNINMHTGEHLNNKNISLSDYGFGAVAKYKEEKKTEALKWKFAKKEIWDSEKQQICTVGIEEYGEEILEEETIYLIDKVSTFAGSLTYNYTKNDLRTKEIRVGESSKTANNLSAFYVYDTYTAELWIGTKYVTTNDILYDIDGKPRKNQEGKFIYRTYSETKTAEKEWLKKNGYTSMLRRYKDEDGKEVNRVFELKKYKDFTYSGVYETIPVVSPIDGVVVNDIGRQYFNEYLQNFQDIYIPSVARTYDSLSALTTIAGSVTEYTGGSSGKVSSGSISSEKQAFIEKVAEVAVEDVIESGVLPSITIAQAILESGWGKSMLSDTYNNYFGIKAGSSWKGQTITLQTMEEDSGGKYSTSGTFRVYNSLKESITDHSRVLWNKRYRELIGNTDYRICAKVLQSAGYATDTSYANLIINIIENNNLSQYDKINVWNGTVPSYASGSTGTGTGINIDYVSSYYGSGMSNRDRKVFLDFVYCYEELEQVTYTKFSKRATKGMLEDILITTENFTNGSFRNEVEVNSVMFWTDTYINLLKSGAVMGDFGVKLDNNSVVDIESTYLAYEKLYPSIKNYTMPIDCDIVVTSAFSSYREINENGVSISGSHKGTDIRGTTANEVYSMYSGVITTLIHNHATAGNFVVITNDDGTKCRYLHLSVIAENLSVGQRVDAGTKIGNVGSTGQSTGNHLHLEWLINDEAVNFYPILVEIAKKNGFNASIL